MGCSGGGGAARLRRRRARWWSQRSEVGGWGVSGPSGCRWAQRCGEGRGDPPLPLAPMGAPPRPNVTAGGDDGVGEGPGAGPWDLRRGRGRASRGRVCGDGEVSREVVGSGGGRGRSGQVGGDTIGAVGRWWWHDQGAPRGSRRQDAAVTNGVHPRGRYRSRKPAEKRQGVHLDGDGAVGEGTARLDAHQAAGQEHLAGLRDGRSEQLRTCVADEPGRRICVC